MKLRLPSKGLIFSLSTAVLWACVIVISRFLLKNGENSLNLTTWLNFFMLFPWLLVFKKHLPEFKKLSKKNIFLLLFIGVSGSIGINYLQALALANTPAVNFAFLYRTIVVFTIFYAWIFFKERITLIKIILVVAILFGSYLLTTNGRGITLSKGDLYTLAMAASAGFIANILVKHTISKMHPDLSGSVTSIIGFITLFTLAMISRSFKIPGNLLLIVLGSVISFIQIMARNRSYKFASASFVTMVISLTPLFVSLLSLPILGERMQALELTGGAIIVLSAILVEKFEI